MRSRLRTSAILRAAIGGLGCLALFATLASAQVRVLNLSNQFVDPFDVGPDARAIAFVFVTVDCPISNRYAPEVRRLHDAFRSRGVVVRTVYVNPADSRDTIERHVREFKYPPDALRDPGHHLVRLAQAIVTPEAAVFHPSGRLLYRGRIDDRYPEIGIDRQTAATHDLEDALAAAAEGRPISNPVTRAVGCVIADFKGGAEPVPAVTFSKHIAPIVFDRCATCHRPNGAAPFSLLTYADARSRGSLMAAVTRRRFMPPWKAEPGYGDFAGQRHLSDQEIRLFQQWVEAGVPEGNPRDLPPRPRSDEGGWQLGTPDLVVTLQEAFTVPASGTDVFRIFVLPLPVTSARRVRGLEFRPGNARVVHHANIRIDRTPRSRQLDAAEDGPGYDGLLARSAEYPAGHFFGWTPGQLPGMLPASLAWRLEPGTDLVIQAHMQPSGRAETVQSSVGLYFADGDAPPTSDAAARTPAMIRLGKQSIDIAAGNPEYTIADALVLPVDVEVLAVQPHAHYLARDVRGTATLPDGTTRPLIYIKDWDFRWQHVYRLATPLRLPKGTTLSMQFSFDNSDQNPRRPRRAPGRVTWGQRSSDEMGDLWIQVLTKSDADLKTLNDAIRPKVLAEDIVGYEMVIRNAPPDAALHDDVAMLYLEVGTPAEAIRHFRTALELKPDVAAAHFNLATALSIAGSLDEAVEHYRRALQLDPNHAGAHNNLGSVLVSTGRRAEALAHFRDAVRLDSSNAQAHRNLAWELAADGGREAVVEAIRAGERAVVLTGRRDPHMLEALAAAQAAAGAFDQAIKTLDAALRLGVTEPLATELRRRQESYRRGVRP
jgi:cytochrome c-type biogenesis protein CcmH/NrfG/mono/diheme cytochrome c family protein